MDAESRSRVEAIYRGALEYEGPSRAAYLNGACPDPEMRRAVEAMLHPSPEAGAGGHGSPLGAGEMLGPYRIENAIGSGGMGTVYKALDTRLNRPVAIKISGARFSDRFEREARAIAALNHPSVCTLYDVGPNYLVMEFVEGVSLQQWMRGRIVPLAEVLQYAAQIAAAMQAAHEAGIVHRDLKPGNVMVTKTGAVKVLDFGLAKVVPPPAPPADSESTTTIDAEFTRVGAIMGSPGYMSPEQAKGKPLDYRSDIFSFGVLLYEMVTGARAFRGDSTVEVLSGVIYLELPPPSRVNPNVGPALDVLVAGCLRKDPAQRFQTMAEVQRGLRGILAGPAPPTPTAAAPAARTRMGWLAAALAGLALAASAVLLWRSVHRAPADDSLGVPQITSVTTDPGVSIDPAISADGNLVAYSSDRSGDGNLDIWVKQLGGGDPIRLTHDPADDTEPNFSPDATHIVFRSERDGGGIYMVPTTGGQERRIADGGRRPQYSPDGTKVVYWTGPADPFPLRAGIGKIFVLDLVTSITHQIRPEFSSAVHPVWSPDGKKVLFLGAKSGAGMDWDWWITPQDNSAPVTCHVEKSQLFDPFAWQGKRVYFAWNGAGPWTISRIAIDAATGCATGKPERLTGVTGDAYSPAVSKQGQVVFSVMNGPVNLYNLPLDANRGKPKQNLERLSAEPGLNFAQSISADGTRLVYTSNRVHDTFQVWGRDFSTGREHALTEGGLIKSDAAISPDGRMVVWRSDGAFVTPFDGGPTQPVCTDKLMVRTWSADGKYLLDDQSSVGSIGLIEFATGKTSTYLQKPGRELRPVSISSDGNWMAFTEFRNAVDYTVYVAPFAPDHAPAEAEWVRVLSSPQVHPDPHWSPDGNLLYFSSDRDGYNCLWAIRLNPGNKHPVGALFPVEHFHTPALRLEAPSLRYPAIALGPGRMVVSMSERSAGIWMLKLETTR
ncbi:MAG TPA: protein kinase [Bryobacteraceae bacterium]|nr:protein kinase [Bryobacteraceae bacterium]